MVSSRKELTDQRKMALTAAISLLIMTLAAFFSYGFVHGSLVVQGDATATYHNLLSSNVLFKAEILGWIIILFCDIVVAWAFYMFLRPIDNHLSLLGAWFRLIYTAVLGIAILNLILVLLLTNSTVHSSLFKNDQLQAHVMLYLTAFETIWSIGLIIFGGHLLLVGYLAFKSNSIPKGISILLLIASIGYIATHLCNTFFPHFDVIMTILKFTFTVPMIVGELGFGIWLLLRGGKLIVKV
ncbi:DUF4386 domain-containing protein [Paenibacillus sp. ACRRX]|uniref:DUF4386 domain-containing protein n=1 Tax=Paenibacillus sp. ACRRX TaxID=2918206 RepID=UPI001EF53050|nr:DUF4386 domain-containing protein [Paenibacillus sp. ACRRX]MCG7410835.1 DUF4386 domain-containing protein [Paenibacillus sp. ACRRX]